jgi:hypothetical protein
MSAMLATLGAALTLALGLLGACAPRTAARLVGIEPQGGVGLAEVRATYGGLFIALGSGCLLLGHPVAYGMAAAAWLGAAALRLVALLVDRGAYPKALGGVLVEGGIGLLLGSGAL